jgi:ABC-type nitrate/sulfonate/bicarbonate transport system ATPase subunit
VKEAADILGIHDLLERKPRQLSGGQRQRVAVGRAIVREPKVFLFDEPLSNLDAKLRVAMRAEISKLHQRLQTTFIYVTHDQTEAMTMAMSRSFGAMSFTTRSPILMFPLVISSSPARHRRAVVLPQPEGPTRTKNSLSATSIFKLLTAVTSPYFLTTFSNATLAMGLSSVSWEYGNSIILPLFCKENAKWREFMG